MGREVSGGKRTTSRWTVSTGGWAAGEIVRDQYDLSISPEAPSGSYRIEVGMYRAETGERLMVEQDDILPDDKIVLGEFVVRSGE
jgi:hypothetical protein